MELREALTFDDVLLVPVAGSGGTGAPDVAGTTGTVGATVVRSGPPGTDGLRVVDVLVDAASGSRVPDGARLGSTTPASAAAGVH